MQMMRDQVKFMQDSVACELAYTHYEQVCMSCYAARIKGLYMHAKINNS
jgi:hypothetical protein